MSNEVLELILRARDEASAGLRNVQAQLTGIAEKARLGERAMGALHNVLTGIGQGLGIAAFFKFEEVISRLTSAIPDLIGQGMRFGETVHNLTEMTGASAEEASRLLGTLEFLGVSTEALGMRMGILSRNVIENEDLLRKLGISIRDSNGHFLNQIEIMYRLQAGLSGVQDGTAKLRIEQAIFGRRAADMAEFFNLTATQAKLLRAEMDRLGITMSEDATAQAEAARKEFNLLGLAVQGVANRLISDVAPALIGAVDAIARWVSENGKAIAAFAANVVNFVLGMITALTGASFATVTFTTALGRIPTLANDARTNVDGLTGATSANTDAIDRNIARIEKQIQAIEARDRAQQRSFERAMSRLQDELTSQLDAIDAAEKAQSDLEAQARLTRELAAAERDLVAAQRSGDPAAIAEARQRVADIVQQQQDAQMRAADDARRAQIRSVKDYVSAIERAETEWTSKKGLLEQLKKDEAILNSKIAAEKARGDTVAVADDEIRLEAVKTAEARAQAAIRNQTQEDALAKEKSRLEDLKKSIGSVGAVIKGLIAPWLDVGKTVEATTAAGRNDMRHFGESIDGPGGLVGSLDAARAAGLRFGADMRKTFEGLIAMVEKLQVSMRDFGRAAEAIIVGITTKLAGLPGFLVTGLAGDTPTPKGAGQKDIDFLKRQPPNEPYDFARFGTYGGVLHQGMTNAQAVEALVAAGFGYITHRAEGGWVGLYGPELVRAGERGPERIVRAEDMPHGGRLAGGFSGTIKIYLDGREIRGMVSRILFEEERAYAGPARAGSAF